MPPRTHIRPFLGLATLLLVSAFDAQAEPNFNELIFDWGVRSPNSTPPFNNIHPLQHTGHDAAPADSTWMQNSIANSFATYPNGIRGFVFQHDTAPLSSTYPERRETISRLAGFLDPAKPIDVIFSDYEYGWTTDKANTIEAARQLSISPNAALRAAYFGQYCVAPHAGTTPVAWWHWPGESTPTQNDQGNSYFTLGVTMANPNGYPYACYDQHYVNSGFGTNRTPSIRAALFWTPIERVSHGMRGFADSTITRKAGAAPGAEHLFIPWVTKFVQQNGYTTQIPSDADSAALLQHYRLRGAQGYNNCGGDTNYVTTALNGWRALDSHFGVPWTKTPTFINLSTAKTAWTQWSAARMGNSIKVLVSNLNPSASQTVTFPDVLNGEGGLPASVSAPANAHTFYTYTIANALDNGRFTSNSASWGIYGTSSWQSTGSPTPGSPGHIRLSGSSFAANSSKILMTPTTKVRLSLKARFEGSSRLKANYYFHNKAGAVMMHNGSSMFAATGVNVSHPASSTWHNITQDFTVANNEQIGHISLILYVFHSDNTAPQAADAIRIDDVVVTFP